MARKSPSVHVITSPRKQFHLANTLLGLEQGGWPLTDCHVWAEPDSPELGQRGINYHRNEEPLGRAHNWTNAFMYAQQESADYYVIMEDDVVVRENVRVLVEHTTSRSGVYSLFTPTFVTQTLYEHGWQRQHLGGSYTGSQFLVITAEIAPIIEANLPPVDVEDLGSYLSLICEENDVPFFCYRPSLAQHTGDSASTLGNESDPYRRMAEDYVDLPIMVEYR